MSAYTSCLKARLFLLIGLCIILSHIEVSGQRPPVYTAADIALELEKLQVVGRVLYIAAHPDDENTRLITHLANEGKYRTAYLSLTRGDGGQNLIGSEIRERLGIIRTQELLQARRTDGGEQYFTRANDFGYSKHPDETFAIWDREQVLSDVVYVIRTFKPDVIITRFNTEPGTTHGHHTASAILASEAFEAAADPNRFPEQLQHTQTWQAERLLWNTSSWFYQNKEDFDTAELLKINVGGYNTYLGKSYTEIAAESRSMHKSQGFGAPLQRGEAIEYLKPVKGSRPEDHLFEGINVSWSRIKGGDALESRIAEIIRRYEPANPAGIVPDLLELHSAILALPANPYREEKAEDVKEVIKASLGLYIEATASESTATPGDSLHIRLEAINRSKQPLSLQRVTVPSLQIKQEYGQELKNNINVQQVLSLSLPDTMPVSQPYWLRNGEANGMFILDDESNTGKPENDPAIELEFELMVMGQPLSYTVPLTYKYTDPAEGEIYQPFFIIPPVAVNIKSSQLLFANDQARELTVELLAGKANVTGELRPELPEGWLAEPASFSFRLLAKGASQNFRFQIIPPKAADQAVLRMTALYNGEEYDKGLEFIRYRHIPTQVLLPEAKVKLVRMELQKKGERIGYLMGAGDDIPQSLRQIGYSVDILEPHELELRRLKEYDAVVLGVRAFNTIEELRFRRKALEDYARQGGTVVVQYNTSFGLVDNQIVPHPISLSRKRVTVEDAPVEILAPNHPALQKPNKITEQDFEGWVQERGLYFPDEWSEEWTPLLASHDPNEESLKGGLLVSRVGKGYYVYTGYSWFRQLPAGVPGAYRLFVNLLSLGKS